MQSENPNPDPVFSEVESNRVKSIAVLSVTHISRGGLQSMVSVACCPVTARTTVCHLLSSKLMSLKVTLLRLPRPGDMITRWRWFSETRNPSSSKSGPSFTMEKMYSLVCEQREHDQVPPDRTGLDQDLLEFQFTLCFNLKIFRVATKENSAGK